MSCALSIHRDGQGSFGECDNRTEFTDETSHVDYLLNRLHMRRLNRGYIAIESVPFLQPEPVTYAHKLFNFSYATQGRLIDAIFFLFLFLPKEKKITNPKTFLI